MTDTFTLTAEVDVDQAGRDVDDLVAELEGRKIKLEATIDEVDTQAVEDAASDVANDNIELSATIDEVDTSEVEDAVERVEGESIEMKKPTIPAPDTAPVKRKLDDLDTRSDQSRSVLANMTGNVSQELGELGGVAGSTGVGLGQLAEYAADGNIALGQLAKVAGPMLALTAAVEIGTRAWKAYTDKANKTKQVTAEVSAALVDQSGALNSVVDELDDLIDADTASAFDRLNAALAEGLDEEEVTKITGALGDLGLTFADLSPTLVAIEGDTDDVRTAMEGLAEQAGIPPEFVDNIAAAVHAGEDMGEITDALRDSLMAEGLSFEDAANKAEELVGSYETQIRAMEQLNDAQQNSDVEKIAEEQLKLARGADTASAALLAQAELELGPDATAMATWTRYIELQNEAAAAEARVAEEAERLQEAQEGFQAFAEAIGSIDWQAAELEAASTAFGTFTTDLFAAGNAVQASEAAFGKLNEAIAGAGLNLDVTTEAGAAQQDALEGIAKVLDTQLAEAYDSANGNQEAFMRSADRIAENTLAKLQEDLGLTDDELRQVSDALGLSTGDFEARYELAGAEEARIQLDLLSGAIEGLPPEVETKVNQLIIAGDYVAARDEVATYWAENPPEMPAGFDTDAVLEQAGGVAAEVANTEVVFSTAMDPSEAEEDAEQIADGVPTAEFETSADGDGAADDMQATADAAPEATILANADTIQAANDLLAETSKGRVAIIRAAALTQSATTELDGVARDDRAATITAVANTWAAEQALNYTARHRTSTITQRSVGTSSSSSSGRAAPAGRATEPTTTVVPAITINAAVIGDRYDVQRVVRRAVNGSLRLGGARVGVRG